MPGLRADGTVRSASVLSDRHWNPPHPTPGPQAAECADSQSALGWGGASVRLTGVQVTRRPGREDHFKERGPLGGRVFGGCGGEGFTSWVRCLHTGDGTLSKMPGRPL